VGKSKLVERFLMDDYHPRQVSTVVCWSIPVAVSLHVGDATVWQRSTFALTLYRYDANVEGTDVTVGP
jgi:hypothetical protein